MPPRPTGDAETSSDDGDAAMRSCVRGGGTCAGTLSTETAVGLRREARNTAVDDDSDDADLDADTDADTD